MAVVLLRGNDFEEVKSKFFELHPDKELKGYTLVPNQKNLYIVVCQEK